MIQCFNCPHVASRVHYKYKHFNGIVYLNVWSEIFIAWFFISHCCSEAILFSIMQIMAMSAARAHGHETRATFIKFSTIQTLHVSMHPALKTTSGLLGLPCTQTWSPNRTTKRTAWTKEVSGWDTQACLMRARNLTCQECSRCCTNVCEI